MSNDLSKSLNQSLSNGWSLLPYSTSVIPRLKKKQYFTWHTKGRRKFIVILEGNQEDAQNKTYMNFQWHF